MAESVKRDYKSNELTERQEKDINNARARAVRHAWKQEKEYVKDGMGTRDWTPEQQEDLVKNGTVQGYEGHHMRSVSNGKTYDEKMEIAGDKNNIQFLESTKVNNEHLKAHSNDTKNRTNGYYDVKTDKTQDFGDKAPNAPEPKKLSNPVMKEEQSKQESHTDEYGVDMSKAEHKSENNKGHTRGR